MICIGLSTQQNIEHSRTNGRYCQVFVASRSIRLKHITNPKHGLHDYCLKNPWTNGLVKLKKDNYVKVTLEKNAQKDRKRAVTRFGRKVVIDGKTNNGTTIGRESAMTCTSSWCDTVHNLDSKCIITQIKIIDSKYYS